MKYRFRRLTIILIGLFANTIAFAQFNNNRLFATYDDYMAGKFIEGYELVTFSWTKVGHESIKVKYGGKTERVKLTALPASLLKFDFKLMRVLKGEMFYVLHAGPICLYTWYGYSDMEKGLSYSESISGEIKPFSEKYFEGLLEEKGLLQSYKDARPKKEKWDTRYSYWDKKTTHVINYLIQMEEKDKKATAG